MQMKKILLLALAIFSFSFVPVFAVGTNKTANVSSIPLPEENYVVQVTDNRQVATHASRVSWNGHTYLQGKRGASLVTIPFAKIKEVRIGSGARAYNASIKAQIILQNGDSLDLLLRGDVKVYGATRYGKFELYMNDIRSIVFE